MKRGAFVRAAKMVQPTGCRRGTRKAVQDVHPGGAAFYRAERHA